MKKMAIVFLIFGLVGLMAGEFKFNPQKDNFNELYKFCANSYSQKGINFEDKKTDREVCTKYLNEISEVYKKDCELGNASKCLTLALLYQNGEYNFSQNDKKYLLYAKKSCDCNFVSACSSIAVSYHIKSQNENDKNIKKEYEKQAKYYYEKACKLGHKLSCNSIKGF
ncbi:tetratricopeptide repeat protein [Campylobacter geochelonis]|uniref:beta-lactamase n=1 Tax=Campylobacter geochelonis TaxID=1780362 RepID=A0A128ES79_9BACT|nr:sel1 repeat family protein [Campylobacter geochelonis]QKF72096.1 hypothetical protein CGEO_1830 [Campylobacter geochelonis]CZE46742.1 conserved hypothetical secreted protein [Campylobacter geochelonis]CZE51579.1 conserved hypothetical secreted protein [Campylobacter geochelonis]